MRQGTEREYGGKDSPTQRKKMGGVDRGTRYCSGISR